MKRHKIISIFMPVFFGIGIVLFSYTFLYARTPQPPDDPPPCSTCNKKNENGSKYCSGTDESGSSFLSLTEGNLGDSYDVVTAKSSFGYTLDLSLFYNTSMADGYKAAVYTTMGFGWTHSYNVYLTEYRFDLYLTGGSGRTTKFKIQPDRTTYKPVRGDYQQLVKNPDGTLTMTLKNGTKYEFKRFIPSPFPLVSPPYLLTKITDRNGNETSLKYDNIGLLQEVQETYGRRIIFTYDSNRRINTIKDPLDRITTLTYDSGGYHLRKITDPAGNSVEYTYNYNNQIIRKKDKNGRFFIYSYNGSGRPAAIKDANDDLILSLSNNKNWSYDRIKDIFYKERYMIPGTTTKTDGRGNKTHYEYNKNGYISKKTAPDGSQTTYTYDPVTLNIETKTDANGNTTRYEYDSVGNLIKVTYALGNFITYTYEPIFNQMTSMTDSNGHMTTWEYDAGGNRIKETDPLGNTLEWTYDTNGNVLSAMDKNGNITTYEYNSKGNQIKIIDAVGCVTTMTYDTIGKMLSRTDGNGNTETFDYDALDRLVKETDPLGYVKEYIYDGEGNRIQVIDCNGNSTSYEYDLRDQPVKITDALGQIITYTYDGNNNRISETDKNGHTTTFEYDVQNRLWRTTDAIGCVTTITYDSVGNKLTETDGNGNVIRYEYDSLNRLIKQTDAVGCVTQYEYDEVGEPGCCGTLGRNLITKQIDGNGKVTYFKYCKLYRLIKVIRKQGDTADVIDDDDAVTVYDYDANGNRLSVAVRINKTNYLTTSYEYDPLNRLVKETNPAGDFTLFTYDCVGNVITTTISNGNVITNTYDAKNRLIQVRDLMGLVTTYTYDCVGNQLTDTDGNFNTMTYEYDKVYRLVKVTDPSPLLYETEYKYDPVGNVIKVIDREDNETTYEYDAVNRRIKMTDTLNCVTTYEYDSVGNLLMVTDTNGNTTKYGYDKGNRRITETYADHDTGNDTRTFTYDCVGNMLTRKDQKGRTTTYSYNDLYFLMKRDYEADPDDTFTYDLAGRMLTAMRDGWLVEFTYDGANRIVQTIQNTQSIDYIYDIPSSTRTITYPCGRVITENADLRGGLESVNDGGPTPIVSYAYDLGNRVTSRSYRNGIKADYTYNANNWITDLNHTSFGGVQIAGFGYGFDKEGNKLYEAKRHDPTDSQAYRYDDIYRLVEYKVGELIGSTIPVPITQIQYDLDCVGNWNRKTNDGVIENRTHNEVNEITTIKGSPITHDDNGNLNEDELYTYMYDEENRLIQIIRKSDHQLVGEYKYDALSRRVVKIANPAGTSTETLYFYDQSRVIEEQDKTGATLASYVYGNDIDEVLTMDRGGQTYYYHQNSIYSVDSVTDITGSVVERYTYDAYGSVSIIDGAGNPVFPNTWGTPQSVIGNPYMFTGRRLDEEAGIYYYRSRYYDCYKGRFLQRDPLGFLDGMNLYEYVMSSPALNCDPFGLKTCLSVTRGFSFKLDEVSMYISPHVKLDASLAVGASLTGKVCIIDCERRPCRFLKKGEEASLAGKATLNGEIGVTVGWRINRKFAGGRAHVKGMIGARVFGGGTFEGSASLTANSCTESCCLEAAVTGSIYAGLQVSAMLQARYRIIRWSRWYGIGVTATGTITATSAFSIVCCSSVCNWRYGMTGVEASLSFRAQIWRFTYKSGYTWNWPGPPPLEGSFPAPAAIRQLCGRTTEHAEPPCRIPPPQKPCKYEV